MIPLSRPDIGPEEIRLVNEVLQSNILSLGPKLEEFEKLFASYIGTKYAIAVNSGTSGLHLCMRAIGISPGDEVITTPFSFVASSNCILFENATPVFVDIDLSTLNMDVTKIEAAITPKTKAILPVHVFGHPCKMDEIMCIAKKYNLAVIEDSCEAIGATYNGQKVGTFGDASVFAFYPNKQMTTGEGGMITTNSKEIYDNCISMRNQGRTGDLHTQLGFNYRLSEINCALGIGQLNRLDSILEKRNRVAVKYDMYLYSINGIITPYTEPNVEKSWFMYVIEVCGNLDRDDIITYLLGRGIQCKPYFYPIHLQPFYMEKFNYKKGDFLITEKVSRTTIALPFYTNMTRDDIQKVSLILEEAVENQG